MRLKRLELNGFKSFSKKTVLEFEDPIVAIVGPNGSGKSNVVEALRFVLGEQSIKSMRGSLGSDLIFKGSKNLPKSSRASVSIYFDNKDKVFKLSSEGPENINLNYDVISISREVFSDGLNKYILNGSDVRLKDINNLLSSVNIGSSGHHIISQGEADRVLNASIKERKEMIEDALGLKIYQYRIREALRKLEKTEENMKEVSLLRKENVPHLNFLRKQVEKLEKAKEMQGALISLYSEYLKKEDIYIKEEKNLLISEKTKIAADLEHVKNRLSLIEESDRTEESEEEKELRELDKKANEIRSVKNEIERKLGRIEGMIEAEGRRNEKKNSSVYVSPEEINSLVKEMNTILDEAINKNDILEIKPALIKIKSILEKFEKKEKMDGESSLVSELETLEENKNEILKEVEKVQKEEKNILERAEILKKKISEKNESVHLKEKERFDLRVKLQELTSSLGLLSMKEENLNREGEAFENEIKEGEVFIGAEIFSYKNFEVAETIDKNAQEELRKKIERIKMKLEDAGLGGGSDLMKEYEEVRERDNFLAKEMEDLEKSIESLHSLIADLKEKIDAEFKEGIEKINIEFGKFFNLMFDGGSGFLSVVTEVRRKKGEDELEETEEETPPEQGVEINASLPHKKVRDLNALSGGERSLTSIALLFAMSQVNPPPFLVLDETDAALDEANSRKYGDMLQKLSRKSELIVVTHNRETMSRAGTLYGVTIGSDGSSKLLSVKLDEATAIAK